MVISSAQELIVTTIASFLLGWTFKKYNLNLYNFSLKGSTLPNTKMVIVVRPDLSLSKGEI